MMASTVWNEVEFFNTFEASCIGGVIPDDKIDKIYSSCDKEKILKAIVKRKKLEILRKLVENPQNFVSNVELYLWIHLINFAAEKEFFELYDELKRLERVYKDQLGKEPKYKYKDVRNHISILHSRISQGEINFVKHFIVTYPKLKLCYLNNFSALEKSINASQFQIFGLLLSKDFDANENCMAEILGKVERNCEEILNSSYSGLILKSIVNRGKLNFLQIFSHEQQNFNHNVKVDLWIELIILAAEKEFFDLYQELKRFKNNYERELNDETLDSDPEKKHELQWKYDRYKNVLNEISKFHVNISKGDFKNVEAFIEKYPKLKFCYGLGDVSPLERSIDASNFEIFELLLAKGFNSNERFYPKLLEKIEQKRDEMLKCPLVDKILRVIVDHRRSKILKVLTQNPQSFIEIVDLNLWTELIKLAAENDFFEIYEELKKLETDYERKNSFKIDYEYKNVLDDISQLHADISNARITEIEKFIAKYPKLKLCYGSSDFCALERSIDARQFHTYAFLRAKGFYSDKGQELKDKIQALDDNYKEKIRVEILKFTKPDPIGLILTKCDLDAASDVLNFQDIRQMLDELIKVEEIKPVLEILAQSDVKIIFDYNEESIVTMDPTADEFTLGLAYFREGILYVGKNSSRDQRFGTFAHEATHFALSLLYENECLPYREEDEERESVWVEVVQNIREIYENDRNGTDNIIKWVYTAYDPNYKNGYLHKAELIVRVNDLLAFYHENPQKCEEVRETYRELFDFYRDHVMPDLNMKNAYRVIKLNNELKLFEKIRNSKFQVKNSRNLYLDQRLQSLGFKNFLLLSYVPQLTLSKLLQEISKKSSNKLDAKVKNIFINFERLQQESLRKLLKEILKTFEVLRVVVYFDFDESKREDQDKNILKFLKDLKISSQIFFVASPNKKFKEVFKQVFEIEESAIKIEGENINYNQNVPDNNENLLKDCKFLEIPVKQSWSDLTAKSQNDVMKLKVKFREEGSILSLQELSLKAPLTNEVLKFLSSAKTPQFDPLKPDLSKLEFFIPCDLLFKIDESTFISMDIDEFINQTKSDKIVVISDLAGSGKTTLLHKIHQSLHKKFQNFWICFVSLLKHKDVLYDGNGIGGNFLKLLVNDVLKLNELEKKIFEFKYEANQVVILFDGFDEISPDCKRNAIKMFKHYIKQKSRIWITTRTHLEEDLERELQVEAHKIEPFALENQKKFLTDFWEQSCYDLDLRKKCANFLVQKISEINDENPNMIGIALQLQLLGEKYKNKLSEKFDEDEKDLSIFHVYESLVIASVFFKPGVVNNFLQQRIKYQALALKNFFDKNHHLFGLKELEDIGELEEFSRGGLTSYDKNGNIYFNHLTVSEFLVSQFISNRIKIFEDDWEHARDFCEFFKELLSTQKFEVVRKFLNDSLKKAFEEDLPPLSLISFAHSFLRHLIKDKNHDWIYESVSNGPSLSLDFLLKCINLANPVAYQEFSDKIKTVHDDIKKLHDDIASGDIEQVENFIAKYPKCKICCGLDKFTALERSIDNKQLKVYAFLKAKKFSTNHKVRLQSKVSQLKDDEKEEIRNEILRLQVDDAEIFVDLILEVKCDLEACTNELKYGEIKKMLHDLRTIEEFKPILEVLIYSDAKLIFDAKKEKTLKTDLEDYEKSVLYVDKIANRNQRYQKFAHGVTKYIFYIFYENNCLPYRVEDKERERALNNAMQEIYKKNVIKSYPIMKSVLSKLSPGSAQNEEVVAFVNSLQGFYFFNTNMNMKIPEDFKAIFNFYKDCVMPDLSIKNAYRVIKLNNKFELFSAVESSSIQMKDYEEVQLLDFNQLQNSPRKIFLLLSDVPQLTLSKLFQEISKSSQNKIHLKVKNIFINFERLEQIRSRSELEEIVKTSEILRLIVFLNNFEEKYSKTMGESFESAFVFLGELSQKVQIFLVASSKFNEILNNHFAIEDSNFTVEGKNIKKLRDFSEDKDKGENGLTCLKVNLKHSSLDVQEELLQHITIKFREKTFSLISFFQFPSQISNEVLNMFSFHRNIEVNLENPEKLDSFIPRKVLMKVDKLEPGDEIFQNDSDKTRSDKNVVEKTLESFIDQTKYDKVVVISDVAGNGKSILLHKIHEILNEKFENFWICFVILREHVKILEDSLQIGENFLKIIIERVLKLNEKERAIFELKYQRNEVVILFDGFDEISPSCKKNSLKIFKLHKDSKTSQIWITTRTHLEHDIESALEVKAHAIKSLTEKEQIKYLSEIWQETCDDKDLREKCAKLLVEQMTKMSKLFPYLIGIILQLRLLGERFKNELSEDFEEKIKNLNISDVYEYLVQSCSKFKDPNSIQNIFNAHTTIYEAFALKNILGDKFPRLFGRTSTLEDFEFGDALEEFAKGGIIRYDKDGKVSFLHRTVEEFFVSRFVKNRIKSFKPNWQYEKDFFELLFNILRYEKFSAVKEFLDNSLRNFEEKIAQGEYKNFQKSLVKFVNESLNFDFKSFVKMSPENLSVTSLFILKCIKVESNETFEQIMQ